MSVEYIGNTRSELEGGDVLVAIIKGIGAIRIIGIGGYTGSVSKSFKIHSKAIYNQNR